MRAETRETAAEKIRKLRTSVAKDKADKVADGQRKSGAAAEENVEGAETRAGGDKVLRIWEAPEELEAVNYTAAEQDMREKVKGPDVAWLVSSLEGGRQLSQADGGSLETSLGQRAGSSGTLQVKDAVWLGDGPGRGEVTTLHGGARQHPR